MCHRPFFTSEQLDQEVRYHPEAVINRLIRNGEEELAERYLPLLNLSIEERLKWKEK